MNLKEVKLLSFRKTANRTNGNLTTVMRCSPEWFDNVQNQRRLVTGRRRSITEVQDLLIAIRHRFPTTRYLADEWLGKQGHSVTARTIYHSIRSFGLQHYRPHLVLLPFTVE